MKHIQWKSIKEQKEPYNGPQKSASNGGFFLLSWIVVATVGAILLGGMVTMLSGAYHLQSELLEYMEILTNQRFIRQVIGQEIRFAQGNIGIQPTALSIANMRAFSVKYRGHQFYRVLSDGQQQPLSGNMLQGMGGKYRIEPSKECIDNCIFWKSATGGVHISFVGMRKDGRLSYPVSVFVIPYMEYFRVVEEHGEVY